MLNFEVPSKIKNEQSVVVQGDHKLDSHLIGSVRNSAQEEVLLTNANFVKLSRYYLASERGATIPIAPFRHIGNLVDIDQNQQDAPSNITEKE